MTRLIRVHGWNNGQPLASGYGLRVSISDRDRFFSRSWESVSIALDDGEARIRLSASFWRTCAELRSAHIGRWLLSRGLAPWPKGRPPQLILEALEDNHFKLISGA